MEKKGTLTQKKGTLTQKRRPKGDPNPQKGPLGDLGPLKGTTWAQCYHGRLGVGGSILAMPRIDGTSSVLTEWLFSLQSVVIVVYGSVQQFLSSIVSFSLSKGITKVPDWLPYHLFQLGVLH